MKKTFTLLFLTILLLGFFGTAPEAEAFQSWRWVLLGQRKINHSLDNDVIELGARQGRYSNLQLKVIDGSLTIYEIVFEYRDGSRDEMQTELHFRPGDDTRIINPQSRQRIIKSISYWYETDSYSQNKATLLVFGSR